MGQKQSSSLFVKGMTFELTQRPRNLLLDCDESSQLLTQLPHARSVAVTPCTGSASVSEKTVCERQNQVMTACLKALSGTLC